MSVFFNGRLWTTPASVSRVDDTAMYNRNLSVGNVIALIGRADGGKPNTPLRFGSPSDAEAVLGAGELLDAARKAFAPSNETGGPAEIVAIRVNPATQASLTLLDGSAGNAIDLLSTDYGLDTNQIKVKVESGTVSGKKVTTQIGNDYYNQDNIGRNAFKIRYSGGQASAVMTVSGTSLVLEAPTSTTVATIDLNVYNTAIKLVDKLNTVAGFAASVQDGNDESIMLNGLDYVTAQDVKTADYVALANLQAVVDWFNGIGEGFITAARSSGAGKVPANIAFTYLAGGSNGTVTNTEWSNAFTTLQTVDVQWVVPVSSDSAIHAMNSAHCLFMSNIARKERRGGVGMASGTTDAQAIAAAKALNSDRIFLTHLGFYDFGDDGKLKLFPPYIAAAMVAGAFAGVDPGTALTNKSVTVNGLERDVSNPTDTDPLIKGGVLVLENTDKGFKVVQSISTWLVNRNYNRVEMSCGVALDFVCRNVRDALDVLRGAKGDPLVLTRAAGITESTLRELARVGIIVGNADSPAYKNIRASLDGDVIRVEFQCSPVIPVNFILTTVFAVPFRGSISV